MKGARDELDTIESTTETDSPLPQSVASHFPNIWVSTILAVALAVLVIAFVVDVAPVIRFGIGLVVFALYMWWFVNTGVAFLDRPSK